MEIPPRNSSNNQDNHKKMSIKICGGGVNVGGFILLGGALALAAATFLGSAFAIKTRKRRSNNHQPPAPEKNDDSQIRNGLTLVLPDSSNNESESIGVAQIESDLPFPTHYSILEEKPNLESNGDDKINLPDGVPKEPESSPLVDESAIGKEEFSIRNNISSPEDASSDEIEEPDDVIEADNSNQIPVEDTPQMLEKGCESDSKIIEEKHEEETKEETESPRNENHEVEEECEGDCINIIVKNGEDGFEAANVEVERHLIEDQEIICSVEVKPPQEFSLSATDSVPENVDRDEELDKDYGALPVIEEETQQMQSNEEQESTRTGDQEAKQKECSMEVFDVTSKEENGDLVVTKDTVDEVKEDEYVGENIAEKCVIIETSHSDVVCVGNEEKIQVSEDQEKIVAEIIEQVDSTKACIINEAVKDAEEDYADRIAVEDNPLVRLDEEEEEEEEEVEVEENENNDDKYTAVEADIGSVNGNPQLKFSENEDGEDEDTPEKAEESSEGTGNSSTESNAEVVWPVEASVQEELSVDDSKINNNNPADDDYKFSEANNDLSKVNAWQVRVWIVLFLAPLLLLLLLVHILKPSLHYDPL